MLRLSLYFGWVFFVFPLWFFSPQLFAQPLKGVILRTQNLKPFNEAIIAFKTACAGEYQELDLKEQEAELESVSKDWKKNPPGIVFAVGPQAAEYARKNIPENVPVIFVMVLDPEKRDLRAPNITGIRMEVPIRTQLEALKGIIPQVKKVGVLYNPKMSESLIQQASQVAQELGFQILASRVERKEDSILGLQLFANGIDVFWLIPDPTVANAEVFKELLKFTNQNRIPFFAFSDAFVKNRALFSLSPSNDGIGLQACEIAKRIQSGTSTSSIVWEYPKNLILSINITTAQQLGFSEITNNVFLFAAPKGYKIVPIKSD